MPFSVPQLWSKPPSSHASARDSWTLRKVWFSVLWGHSFFLLGSGVHKVFIVPSKSLFPQSCISSGGSMVGLMAASSKRAYAIPRSAAPRAPSPMAGHCWHVPPQETLKHWGAGLAQSLWGLLVHTSFCLSPLSVSGRYGSDSKCDFALTTIFLRFAFALGHGISFFDGIQHSPVDGCSAVSCKFGVLAEDECVSFYSAIL